MATFVWTSDPARPPGTLRHYFPLSLGHRQEHEAQPQRQKNKAAHDSVSQLVSEFDLLKSALLLNGNVLIETAAA
jgi:hypothetical protein